MDNSGFKEKQKNEENITRRKELKEEEAGSRKWKLKHRQR
jgi:hypothetical protein